MASRRKVFIKTDLRIPHVEHERSADGIAITAEIPPSNTWVRLTLNSGNFNFDFSNWYGSGIDQITYACQRQIERFAQKQDADIQPTTIATYCVNGMRYFLEYMVVLRTALDRDLQLADIDRNVIDGFLASLDAVYVSPVTKRSRYHNAKAVLKALCARGIIIEVVGGDDATFPANPFPGADAAVKGAKPLSIVERKAFSSAVKQAVVPLFDPDVEVTADLLGYALLAIALHTGRNTTPLLEMRHDALKPHPKADTWFLVLYKRRGHCTSKVAIRGSRTDPSEIELVPTLRPTVAAIVQRAVQLSRLLAPEAGDEIRHRVWLYRMRTSGRGTGFAGEIRALNESTLACAAAKLVEDYGLVDADGKPLRVTVSRLRKTFVNRVYEILDGDIAATAAAAGNTVRVTSVNYLRPGEQAVKNWRFLGKALTDELLSNSLGATEYTPVGRCSDSTGGEYAPKNRTDVCMSFLNCLRCSNYVVTGDDLYRLFSFYWRILAERARMDPHRWKRQLSHIVRLIDRDVIEAGLQRGVFKQQAVDSARERARHSPHSFWAGEHAISDLASMGGA